MTPVIGVSYPALLSLGPATQAAQLAQIRAAGFTSVRIDADWSAIQPAGSTRFNWAAEDQAVTQIRAAGLDVLLVIDGCPDWAGHGGEWSAPRSPAAYATFAGQVAARYAPQGVHMFEVWNEPNIDIFWKPRPSPSAYTALLLAACPVIHHADPQAFVISAGLAPAATDGVNWNARDYLASMYAHGAKGHLDGPGIHPYCYPALPTVFEPWSAWEQMNMTRPSIRSVLTDAGDSIRQLWLTEFGAPDTGPDGVGAQGQADQIRQGIQLARTRPWIGGIWIYTWSDTGQAPIDGDNTFGLVTGDGGRKLAYAAAVEAISGPPDSSP